MQVTLFDRQSYDITRREYTDEGFLRVPGRVARTGIQEYLASELGMTDRQPNAIVRIFRPEEEVFSDASLQSYVGADVTDDHPPQMVDANCYKQYSVGTTISPGTRDGDFVNADLIVKDRNAIQSVEAGKVQLSAGYTAEYDMTPGTTPDGQSYDGVQRSIRINHVAIVSRARAGAQARLFDHQGDTAMITITLDSGSTVEVADKAVATLITDSIARLNVKVTEQKGTIDTQKTCIDSLNTKVKELETKTSDAALSARVTAVADARIKATKVAGDKFACDSADVVEIQRAALKMVDSKTDWSDKAPAYIEGQFDAAVAAADQRGERKPDDEDEEDTTDVGGRGRERGTGDSAPTYTQLAKDGAGEQQPTNDAPKMSAYDSYKDGLKNAWDKGSK